jgi:hypothetical protein
MMVYGFLFQIGIQKIVQTVVFQIGGGIAGDFPMWVPMFTKIWKYDVPFGVISVKFQIQQLVTVPILEQYQMKNYLG